jgi:hypothetical protein
MQGIEEGIAIYCLRRNAKDKDKRCEYKSNKNSKYKTQG